jgi:hypothetical protein
MGVWSEVVIAPRNGRALPGERVGASSGLCYRL